MAPRLGPPLSGEPEHVASGAFRVDRARLLETLARFALEDRAGFAFCWVRCAALSDARQVRIWKRKDGLELRFGGRPFARVELENPYRCLGEEGVVRRRNRELALGLLTAFAGPARRVTLETGPYGGRLRFEAQSRERETVSPVVDAGTEETVILVELDSGAAESASRVVRRDCERLVTFEPLTVQLDETWVPLPRLDRAAGVELAADGLRARLRPTGFSGDSRLDVFVEGLSAGTVSTALDGIQADGAVDADGLALDLSGAVVRNERLEALLARVELLAQRAAWVVLRQPSSWDRPSPAWEWRLRLESCRRVAGGSASADLRALRDAIFFSDERGFPMDVAALERRLAAGDVSLRLRGDKDAEAARLLFPKGKFGPDAA